MAWIIGIIGVLAVGWFILGRLANSNNPKIQEMVEEGRQIRTGEREFGETLEQATKRKRFDAMDAHYDKIMDLLNEDKYRAALNLIEKTLADEHFNLEDDVYGHDVADCFTNLAENKTPQAVLNFYDKLKSEGNAVAYAEKHGRIDTMSTSLTDALNSYPEIKTKAALRKAIEFVRGNHPLLVAGREFDAATFVEFLDTRAEAVFDDWKVGDHGEELAAVIAAIEAKL